MPRLSIPMGSPWAALIILPVLCTPVFAGMDPLVSPEFGGLLTPEWAKRDRSHPPPTGACHSALSSDLTDRRRLAAPLCLLAALAAGRGG
jgi:hypothetical protein